MFQRLNYWIHSPKPPVTSFIAIRQKQQSTKLALLVSGAWGRMASCPGSLGPHFVGWWKYYSFKNNIHQLKGLEWFGYKKAISILHRSYYVPIPLRRPKLNCVVFNKENANVYNQNGVNSVHLSGLGGHIRYCLDYLAFCFFFILLTIVQV